MEVNKDEAERCIQIAKTSVEEGDSEKAKKFLNKAERLFPTDEAKALLERVSKMPPPKTEPETVRKRRVEPKKEESTAPEYTPNQLEAVKRIKKCKDYYEILEVTKEATDSDIKKAYKKHALAVHPDKNKSPGAAEAFKALGNACAVLTDAEKRKQYDMYGSEDERMSSHHHRHHTAETYTRGFESDATAEEIFNMFFGGGFPAQNIYVRRERWQRREPHHRHREPQQQNGYTAFLQMLPILLAIILSMMSSFFISDPVYSLQSSHKYPVARKTMNLKVNYYVKENFHSEYQGSLRRLEMSVEEEYVTALRHACYREKSYRDTMIWKARNFGERELYQKAQSIRTPSCDTLTEIQAH